MNDILTINQLVEMVFAAAEKAIDPANLIQERTLISDLDLGSGGYTVVRNIDGIKAYESRARFDVSEINYEKLQQKIERAFYVDKLSLRESPAIRSATEVEMRYRMLQRILGPTVTRIQTDFLNKVVERTFRILLRAGELPDPPAVLAGQDVNMDIQYFGPLHRSQKAEDVQNVQLWLEMLAAISAVDQNVVDIPDADQIALGSADMLGVPALFIRGTEDIQKAREQRQKMMMEQMSAQQANIDADTAQKFAKAESQTRVQ
jgi:hypothetical protein